MIRLFGSKDAEHIWHEEYVKAGDRRGQHSIRVNAQWRLCFVWREGGAVAAIKPLQMA